MTSADKDEPEEPRPLLTMTDDSSARFPKLGNTGQYPAWAPRMKAILVRAGLWKDVTEVLIDETGKTPSQIEAETTRRLNARDVDDMARACAEIVLRVEDSQLAHIGRFEDPLEMWQTLRLVHRAAGFATSLALRRKLLTSTMTPGESMQNWISRIQALAFRLEDAGIDVPDQDRILALTMGLPDEYEAVIINFDSTPPDLLTLDHVITRLLNEEARQESKTPDMSTSGPGTADEALAVVPASRRAARSTARVPASITCFLCGEQGHYRSDCPEAREWEAFKKARKGKAGTAAIAIEEYDSDGLYD